MAQRPPEAKIPYYRKTGGSFQPRFTLSLLYLFGFFFLYCVVLVAPSLVSLLQSMPPGPEQQAAAAEVAQDVVAPRLWIAVLLSAATTVAGAHYRLLPGLRAGG